MIFNKELEFWSHEIKRESKSFEHPVVLKNQLSKHGIRYLRDLMLETFRQIPDDCEKNVRLFLKDTLISPAYEVLSDRKPSDNESIESWASRCFDKEFGIIFNSVQNYSDELAQEVYTIFQMLYESSHIPLGGMDISFFIGNYRYTPLGFHKDPGGHKVTHLHLGPGTKEMFLIDPQVYEQDLKSITLSPDGKFREFKDYTQLLPYATKYTIEPGDVFFMPWGKWHVGRNKELSASLTLWHLDSSTHDLQRSILGTIRDRLFSTPGQKEELVIPRDIRSQEALINFMKLAVNINQVHQQDTLMDCIEQALDDYTSSLVSNAYFMQKGNIGQHTPEKFWPDHALVSGKQPFRILMKALSSDKIALFLRGHRVVGPANPELPVILEKLNARRKLTIGTVCSLLSRDWNPEASRQFISLLYRYKTINISV